MSSIEMRARRTSRFTTWLAGAAIALGASGCFFEGSTDAGPGPVPGPPPPGAAGPGSLTIDWTVDEVTDPNTCIMGDASSFDIVLRTTDGQIAGEFQASCTAFSTTISSLAPGNYTGSAELLDGGGGQRTTEIVVQPFTIIENTNLVITLDFPANSFL